MSVPSRPFALLLAVVLAALVIGSPVWAQADRAPAGPASEPNGPAPSEGSSPRPATQASSEDELALTQSRLADKYARLEDLLIRMSELEGANNPQRSALLLKAAQQSKEKLTRTQLNNIVKLLNQKQLKRAVTGQEEVQTDLKSLLDLLLSENRSNRLKNEQARMREYIKEVERLIRQQKTVQGRTEGAADPKQLAEEQGKVADKTGELAKQMQLNEEGEEKSSPDGEDAKDESGDPTSPKEGDQEKKPSDSSNKPTENQSPSDQGKPEKTPPGDSSRSPKEPKTPDPKQGDQPKEGTKKPQPDGAKPKDGESEKPESGEPSSPKPSGESPPKPSDSSKPPQGESPPSEGSGQEPSPPMEPGQEESPKPEAPKSDGFPARKRLAAAEDRMREAERKLKEAKRNEAQDAEEKAREELEKAKAELEEILRQLREEEVERMLAMLEGRFRRILESQLKIYESTKRLDQVPVDQRDREFPIQASRLSFDESKLAAETLKTLNLLHEDGSSLAFPESVEQMHDDMQQVTERLATTKVDKLTQGIEEEIIAALEEMIDALQKAQQDAKEKKEQNQPPPGGQPNEPPLVDQLAELKMIRALQMRVNTRTQRYAKMLENIEDPVGQALEAELIDVLAKLAEREQRIHELTRDIVLGKNK